MKKRTLIFAAAALAALAAESEETGGSSSKRCALFLRIMGRSWASPSSSSQMLALGRLVLTASPWAKAIAQAKVSLIFCVNYQARRKTAQIA